MRDRAPSGGVSRDIGKPESRQDSPSGSLSRSTKCGGLRSRLVRGFQAPLDQFDIALVFEDLEDFWRLERWLVWIKGFVQLVLRTNGRPRPAEAIRFFWLSDGSQHPNLPSLNISSLDW